MSNSVEGLMGISVDKIRDRGLARTVGTEQYGDWYAHPVG